MKVMVSHPKLIRVPLGVLHAFLALNAFGGGIYGMSGAEGVPLELLEGSPFNSYFFPSLILFVMLGGSALAAAVAVFIRHRLAVKLSFAVVLILFGWLLTQVAIIGYASWMQPATAMLGVLILALTLPSFARASSP
jgi:hypothetical protein